MRDEWGYKVLCSDLDTMHAIADSLKHLQLDGTAFNIFCRSVLNSDMMDTQEYVPCGLVNVDLPGDWLNLAHHDIDLDDFRLNTSLLPPWTCTGRGPCGHRGLRRSARRWLG